MSLINKMLRDLDKRHAVDAGGKKTLTEQLRPVQAPKGRRRIVIEIVAGLMVGIGWAAWVMYAIAPRSLVTDLALRAQLKRPGLAPASQPVAPAVAQSPAAAIAATAPAEPPMATVAAGTARVPAVSVPEAKVESLRLDTLKFATVIGTPFNERGAGARPRTERKPPADATGKETRQPAAEATASANLQAPKGRAASNIEKQVRVSTPAERAESEFRKATGLLNQGRVAEAIEGYKATLAEDAAHGAARQALVGLLLENRRIEEAQRFLQEGLNISPDRTNYAMLLARIQVDRGDAQGAHDLLSKHAANTANNADYLAFDAAVLQRLGRHKEAVAAYQTALKLAPNAGVWWMGMGISLQADSRDPEARDAFNRAKSAGGLSTDLMSFIDQRLKQLR